MSASDRPDRYAEAGVNIPAANRLVERIKELAKTTFIPGVMTDIGGFGGLFRINATRVKNPVLVASTDGVGTKLRVAIMANRHDTVGIDLVAMCVNDILVCGAKPLFFLDYIATGKLDEEVAYAVLSGVAAGCQQAKMALLGGETAEMPGLYAPGDYDLAGFVVGVVDNDRIIDGTGIKVGDKLVGVGSSGLHSNGYSLVRKIIFNELKLGLADVLEGVGSTVADELLKPTKIYAEAVANLLRDLPVSGMAHITGGGLTENLPRILPQACRVEIEVGSWPIPPIFTFLQKASHISPHEMFRNFNNGVGLVVAVPQDAAPEAILRLKALGEEAWIIGRVAAHEGSHPVVRYV